MTEMWNTYIQINIYGRTLKDLQNDGIYLKSVLNDIGCSKTWIVEGSMYDGESSDQDETINQFGPVLSTTMATTRAPYFSTPMVSQVDLLSKSKMRFSEDLSSIGSSTDSELTDSSDDDNDPEPGRTGLNDISSSVNALVAGLVDQVARKFEEVKPKTIGRSMSTAPPRLPLRRSFTRRRSAPQYKLSLSRRQETKASLGGVAHSSFGPSRFSDEKSTNRENTPKASDPILLETKSTEPILTDMSPIYFDNHSEPDYEPDYQVPADGPLDFEEPDRSFAQYDMDYDMDEFHSMDEDNDTVQIYSEATIELHTPPPPNLQPTSSILRKSTTNVSAKESRVVSFKVPSKIKSRTANNKNYAQLNKTHQIKCEYQGCCRVFPWKQRYGKLRLIDHALTHTEEKCLACRNCNYNCRTTRQMRYHYEKKHSDMKMQGFGMLEVFSMPIDAMDVGTIWNTCYEGQMDIVGKVSSEKITRRKMKMSAKEELVEEEEKTEEDAAGPSTSNPGGNNFF